VTPAEIIVIDSASEDRTVEIARSHGARVEKIARDDFDHGGTRARGARMAAGDILVYMTQDALPVNNTSLANLVAPFRDSRVAATYGRQLPHEDASCFARHLRLFNYPRHSARRCWEDRWQYGFKTAFISNSFAAYRKELLAAVGYFADGLLFGEDTFTVAKLLRRGYCVVYAADASVLHSHNYTVAEDFRRYFDIGVVHERHRDLVAELGSPAGEGKRYVRSEIGYLVRERHYLALPASLLRSGMKYTAYNLGRRYRVLPRCLAECCSLNRSWWKRYGNRSR
jgi:rhamnosyltransferase